MTVQKEEKLKVEFDKHIHGGTLRSLIEEASDHRLTIEGFQDLIKDIKGRAKDELGVDSKMFNKLLNIRHKEIRESFENENEEVIELYDTVFA